MRRCLRWSLRTCGRCPMISHRAIMGIYVCGAEGELMQVGFPKHHAPHSSRRCTRAAFSRGTNRARILDPAVGGIPRVKKRSFQADRDAVQDSPVMALHNFLFRFSGLGHRGVCRYCDIGVDRRLQPFNAVQERAREFDRR